MASSSERRSSEKTNDSDNLIAGRYLIEKKISKLEKTSTYSVLDTKNDNDRKCLKKIKFSLNDKNVMKEYIREEKVLSKTEHPYILKYHESFKYNDNLCIITEYCEYDLATKIKYLKKHDEKLPEEQILYWFTQLLSACNYLHSNRVLHRNIKPGNILLKHGNIKLGDFGISRILDNSENASTFIGTPYYMSPEIIENQPYNSKSDIWSIGCVLYELATYQHPFIGDSIIDIFRSVSKEKTPSIQHLYSKELNQILKLTLIKNPKERPSALELLNEPFISNYVCELMQKRVANARTPEKIAGLIDAMIYLNDNEEDENFGEYDDKSTLRSTPKSSIRTVV